MEPCEISEPRNSGEVRMSETQVLLTRIAALRQQLEQAKGLTTHPEAGAARGAWSAEREAPELGAPRSTLSAPHLERLVADGSRQTVLLDRTLRQLTPDPPLQDASIMPKQLTARARRILEEGRELLGKLRNLAETFEPPKGMRDEGRGMREEKPIEAFPPSSFIPHPSSLIPHPSAPKWDQVEDDPLTQRYRQTVAMANTALRMLLAFPDAASAQLSLCEGLETILAVVGQRISEITAVLEQRRRETEQLETLAGLLTALYAKQPVSLESFVSLAETLLAEAKQATPLRFLSAQPHEPDAPARGLAGASGWSAARTKSTSAPSLRPIQFRCICLIGSGQSTWSRSSSKRSA
jgi:hypothetical protein